MHLWQIGYYFIFSSCMGKVHKKWSELVYLRINQDIDLCSCFLGHEIFWSLHDMYISSALVSWYIQELAPVLFLFHNVCFGLLLQIVLVVESVSAILNYDRKLRKLSITKPVDGKSWVRATIPNTFLTILNFSLCAYPSASLDNSEFLSKVSSSICLG